MQAGDDRRTRGATGGQTRRQTPAAAETAGDCCARACGAQSSKQACIAMQRVSCAEATAEATTACCDASCGCFWNQGNAEKAAPSGHDGLVGKCIERTGRGGQQRGRNLDIIVIFIPVFTVVLLIAVLVYCWRLRRSRKARRIVEAMPRAWPDAPTNAEVDATVLETQDSPIVCRVVSAHTYTDPEQADADRPAHVLACDMCETQALVGAAICSKCGRGLFLVAQSVNLVEENRAWHRLMRDTMQDYHASDQEIPRVRATFAQDRHRLLAGRRMVSTPSAIPRGVSPALTNSQGSSRHVVEGSSRHVVEDVLSAAPPAHQERLP